MELVPVALVTTCATKWVYKTVDYFTGVVDEIDHKIITDFNPPSTIDSNSL